MRVTWTPPAKADLADQAAFIALDNVGAAIEQEARVYAAVDRLADYPQLGRVGRMPGTRELVVGGTPYLVIYRVGEDEAEVLRVMHGARAWPPADD